MEYCNLKEIKTFCLILSNFVALQMRIGRFLLVFSLLIYHLKHHSPNLENLEVHFPETGSHFQIRWTQNVVETVLYCPFHTSMNAELRHVHSINTIHVRCRVVLIPHSPRYIFVWIDERNADLSSIDSKCSPVHYWSPILVKKSINNFVKKWLEFYIRPTWIKI